MKGNKNGTQFDSSSLTISAQKTQLQVILNQFITEIHTKNANALISQFLFWINKLNNSNSNEIKINPQIIPDIPGPTVSQLRKNLSEYVVKISQELTQEIENLSFSEDTFFLLRFIVILSSSSLTTRNVELFIEHQLLIFPIQILKLLLLKLAPLRINLDSGKFEKWWNYWSFAISLCFQFIQNLTSPASIWKSSSVNEKATYQLFQLYFQKSKILCLNQGLFRIIKDLLDLFSFKPLQTIFPFRQYLLILDVLGGIMDDFPAAQTEIRNSKILESLLNFIGWKNLSEPFLNVFELQIICLEILGNCMANSNDNLQRISQLGGMEKILDLILWTFFYTQNVVKLDEKSPSEKNLDDNFSPQLKEVFRILFFICKGNQTEQRLPEKIIKTILCLLLDLFNTEIRQNENNIKARSHLLTSYPQLQFLVIDFIMKLFSAFPSQKNVILNIATGYQIWDVFFSDFFFPENNSSSIVILKEEILALIAITTTVENYENVTECSSLLTYLERTKNLDNIIQISKCIILMLNEMNELVYLIFNKQNAIPIFIQIINNLQKLKNNNQNDPSITEEKLIEARRSMITVLGYLTGFDKIAYYALENSDLRNLLLSHIIDPQVNDLVQNQLVFLMKINHSNISLSQKLCENYLDILNNFETQKSFPTIKLLLEGIRYVVEGNSFRKDTFREAGVFIRIVTLLNNEHEKLPLFCEEVLKTLTCTLSENKRNKQYFSQTIGYDQLKNLLIRSHPNGILSNNVLSLLFDMLVDGNFENGHYLIRNENVVLMLFSILNHFTKEDQLNLLSFFSGTISKCTHNISICCNLDLISKLLDLVSSFEDMTVLEKLTKLIEILGRHSITIQSLKKLFTFLKRDSKGIRIKPFVLLLESLNNMLLGKQVRNPEVFYSFDGGHSVIIIPPIEKFPSKGYTFCTWLRIESTFLPIQFNVPNQNYEPRLFSFLTEDGLGLEAYFYGNQLHVISNFPKASSSVTFSYSFQTKKWYCICISHTKSLLGQSEIKLYVNGEFIQKELFKYPTATLFTSNFIGSNPKKTDSETYFFGQMGSIYFLDQVLSDNHIQSFFNLTPDYLNCFDDGDFSSEGISKTVIFNYNAKACEGTISFNNAQSAENSLHAELSSVVLCITRDPRVVISSLGGSALVLPLFAQLDETLYPSTNSSREMDVKITVSCFALLRKLLDPRGGKTINQEEMLKLKGFPIISYLLQKSTPELLSEETFSSMKKLVSKMEPELKNELLKSFFLDFRLWIYSKYEVQLLLLNLLNQWCSEARPDFRIVWKKFGVQGFLDTLRNFYWENEDFLSSVQAKEKFLHPITKNVVGQRPPVELRTGLRLTIYSILKKLFKSSEITLSDFLSICSFLMVNSDTKHQIELLSFLSESISSEPFLRNFITIEGHLALINLLKSENDLVRASSVKSLGYIFSKQIQIAKKITLNSIDFVSISQIYLNFPLTQNTYHALLSCLLGQFTPSTQVQLTESKFTRNIELESTIFILLEALKDTSFQKKIIDDLTALIFTNQNNLKSLSNCLGWQSYVFDLLSVPLSKNDLLIYESLIKFLVTFHVNQFQFKMDGWKSLKTTILLYYRSQFKKYNSSKIISLELLYDLLTHICDELILISASPQHQSLMAFEKTQQQFIINIIRFTLIIEDFIFHTPYSLLSSEAIVQEPELHYTKDKNWEDLKLSIKIVELLDNFKLLYISNFSQFESSLKLRSGGIQRVAFRFIFQAMLETATSSIFADTFSKSIILLRKVFQASSIELQIYAVFLQNVIQKPTLYCHVADPEFGGFFLEILKIYHSQVPLSKNQTDLSKWLTEIYSRLSISPSIFEKDRSNWNTFAQTLSSSINQLASSEKNFLISSIKSRRFTFSKLQTKLEQQNIQFLEIRKKYETETKIFEEKIMNQETERRKNFTILYQERLNLVENSWRSLLRNLTNERGAWVFDSNIVNKWKLDKTENFSRMRLKLKPNYHFDDHLSALSIKKSAELAIQLKEKEEETIIVPFVGLKPTKKKKEIEEDSEQIIENSILDLPQNVNSKLHESNEKSLLSFYCELIKPFGNLSGKLDIYNTHLTFRQEEENGEQKKVYKWFLDQIREIQQRRYLLRPSALEIFLVDRTNVFLNFSKKDRTKAYFRIKSLNLPNLINSESRTPAQIMKKSKLTQMWQTRQISNFEYLMQLNTISGRTYNDLQQYPVFPWVIADYTSEKLDLNNPASFRDLSKPIGALNPDRLKHFIERYNTYDDPEIPKFHYGSHYSSAATVLYYLIRMEPFTTLSIQFQGGKFDVADRMFHSIAQTWKNTLNNTSDVKELIPEFFYQPEFLVNSNGFTFGTKQNGEDVNNVILPPWAKTPEDFIRINREALESEYVSQNLHLWIDLIFGYKQDGQNAIDSYNVFYYLTYEGAVDFELIGDERAQQAIKDQIQSFGQTPTKLFDKSHPQRNPLSPFQISLFQISEKLKTFYLQITECPLIFIGGPEVSNAGFTDRIVTIDSRRFPASHQWIPVPSTNGLPFTFELDPYMEIRKAVGIPISRDISNSPYCFHLLGGKTVISCGHWDNSIRLTLLDSSKLIQTLIVHQDIVTCLSLAGDKILVTCSKDTTVMVWELIQVRGNFKIQETPKHVLYGHDDEVMCIVVEAELDVVVSGSKDGSCIIHTLRSGKYVRSIFHPKRAEIRMVAISSLGHIVFYSPSDLTLYVFSVNGKFLCSTDLTERIGVLKITRDAEYLITGSEKGILTFRKLHNLQIVYRLTLEAPICSLYLTPEEQHLFVGLQDGKMALICRSSS